MKTKRADKKGLELEGLVRQYLRLDPAALASLGAKEGGTHGAVEAGLHEFTRRVLETAVDFLFMPEDAIIRLRSAKVPGWPDAKTFNLAQLFAWGLAREPRRLRGLPQLPVYAADRSIVDLPRKPDTRQRSSVAALAALTTMLFEIDFDQMRDAPGPDARQPISICQLIQDVLGVRPELLIRPYYDTQEDADEAFARDLEAQAAAGLSAALMRVLHNYPAVVAAQTPQMRCIGFWIANDAQCDELDGAHAANIRALLMAGLLMDGSKEIAFFG